MRLVEVFSSVNVPLHVLDDVNLKAYLETNLKGIGVIPSAHQLRQQYLIKVFEEHIERLKYMLRDVKSVAVVCEESTDAEDRYVFNVLAVPCLKENDHVIFPKEKYKLRVFLLDGIILPSTNFKTVSEAVLNTLYKFEILLSKISAFVIDNAPYMYKAWNSSLKAVLLNSVHVTCTVHLLNLICEVWQHSFPAISKLVASVKKLSQHVLHVRPGFDSSCATKVNLVLFHRRPLSQGWFQAAFYHTDHLVDYSEFFGDEVDSSSLNIYELVDFCVSSAVKDGLTELRKYTPEIMSNLTEYEGEDVKTHLVTDEVTYLTEWMDISASEVLQHLKQLFPSVEALPKAPRN